MLIKGRSENKSTLGALKRLISDVPTDPEMIYRLAESQLYQIQATEFRLKWN